MIMAVLALLGYVYLLFSLTVIYRPSNFKYSHFMVPFWSYRAILDGRHELIAENLVNVVMFVPIGFLLRVVFKSIRWKGVLFVSLSVSITIEFLQFALNRGSAEVDDVMHNLLGGIIGYGLFIIIKTLFKRGKGNKNEEEKLLAYN